MVDETEEVEEEYEVDEEMKELDEAKKSSVNTYFTPQISKTRGICSVDDIIGKWYLVFRGTDYPNLEFNITEKILPGTNTNTVC